MSPIQIISIVLCFFTGFSGLVYEVTWHKYLANIIGSESKATAIVLSIFLFGLACGYAYFGKHSRERSPRYLLKATAWIEIAIAVWAFIFPQLYSFMWDLTASAASSNFFIDVLICIILIGFPTFLMGGTLPLLTQALSRNFGESSSVHAYIYSTNTAGAFFGCLLSGFVIIPALGLPMTILLAGILNALAGIGLLALSTRLDSSVRPLKETAVQNSEGSLDMKFALVISFLNGYLSISFQNIFVRLIGFATGASEYSFTIVVSVFVFGLALGARQISTKDVTLKSLIRNQIIMFLGLGFVLFTVPYWAYGIHVWRTMLTDAPPNFVFYYGVIFASFLFVLWPSLTALGKTMPAVFSLVRTDSKTLGADVGKIYFFNTLGCVFGGLLGGYLLMHFLSIEQNFRLNLILSVVMIAVAAFSKIEKPKLAFGAASLAIIILVLPNWPLPTAAIGTFRWRTPIVGTYSGLDIFNKGLTQHWNLIDRKDSPNGSAAILERSLTNEFEQLYGQKLSRSLLVNGKPDGDTAGDRHNMIFAGHLGGLLSSAQSDKTAVIGFGTGLTVGALSLYPNIEKIDTIEISEAVKDLAHHFDFANYGASNHRKVTWQKIDAYRFLMKSEEKYASIISEPSHPWVSGVERLFAQDFYNIVLNRLDRGGVYVQWFQSYEVSPEVVGIIVRTFSSVFPEVRIFHYYDDMFMVGSREPMDKGTLLSAIKKMEIPSVKADLAKVAIHGMADVLAHETWISPKYFSEGEVHNLNFPILAYKAGKDFFFGRMAKILDFSKELDALWGRNYVRSSLFAQAVHSGLITGDLQSLQKAFCNSYAMFTTGNVPQNPACDQIKAIIDRKGDLDMARAPASQMTVAGSDRVAQLIQKAEGPLWSLDPQKAGTIQAVCGGATRNDLICKTNWYKAWAFKGDLRKMEALEAELQPHLDKIPATELEILRKYKAAALVINSPN